MDPLPSATLATERKWVYDLPARHSAAFLGMHGVCLSRIELHHDLSICNLLFLSAILKIGIVQGPNHHLNASRLCNSLKLDVVLV